jgi:type II secretion system protein D
MTLRTIQHGLRALLLSVICGATVAVALAQETPPPPAPESQGTIDQKMDRLREEMRKGREQEERDKRTQGTPAPTPTPAPTTAPTPVVTPPPGGAAPTDTSAPGAAERKPRLSPEELRARARASTQRATPAPAPAPAPARPANEVAPSDVPPDFIGPPPHLVQVQSGPAAEPNAAAPAPAGAPAASATEEELTRPPLSEDENWFQFDKTPWEDVIRRFVERIGKPLMTPEADLIIGGELTYKTDRKFTKEEAIDELNLIMQEKGYRFVERPNHIYIVPLADMRAKVELDRTFNSVEAFLEADPRDMDYVAVYYQVKDQPAQFFVDVFADALPDAWLTAMKDSNQIKIVGVARDVRKFLALKDLVVLTPDDPRQMRIYKIKTNAMDIEQRVRQLLNIGAAGVGVPVQPQMQMVRDPRTGQMVPRPVAAAPAANATADAGTQMVADERTNSIIVKATADKMKEIEGLIETLDIEPPLGKFKTEVIEVEHADATAVATLLQSILQQEQGQAAGGVPNWQMQQQQAILQQQRMQQMMQMRQRNPNQPMPPMPVQNPMAMQMGNVTPESIIMEGVYERARKTIRLVADSRTNSLIVYANDEGFQRVRDLLLIIDKPMPDSYKVFSLDNAKVTDVAPLLTQLVQGLLQAGDTRTGRSPSIITDESTNTLHVIADKVEMDRIENLIHQLDVSPPTQERHIVELENLRPSQVAQLVQTLLSSSGGGAVAPTNPALNRMNRMGRRGQMGQPGMPGMTTPATPTVTGTSAREYQVIALDEAGVLIVMCSDEDWAKVEDTVRMWDEKARTNTPKLKTFEITTGNPQSIAGILGGMYRQYDHPVLGRSSVMVQADGNTLYVYGVQPAIDEITALLPTLDVATDADQIEVLTLANADAAQVAQQIQPYFGAGSGAMGARGGSLPSGGRGPIINVEPVTNSLIVQAGKTEMEKIKNLALLLDQNIAKVATEQKFFTMRYAQAQDVAAAVQNIFGGQRVGRGAASPIKAMAAGSQVVVEAPHERMQTIEAFITKMDDPQGKQMVTRVVKLAGVDVQQVAQNLTAWFRSQPARPDRLTAMFIPDNTTESLIVSAPADLGNQIDELIANTLTGTEDLTLERRLYPIQNTDASYVADILKQQLPPQVEQKKGKIVAQRINISLDDRQNQLVINAPRFVHPMADELIAKLDREAPDQTPVTVSLKYADATQVVQTIQAMFKSTGGGKGQLQDVQVTASGSQLIIKAPKKKQTDILALVAAMDSEDTSGGIKVKTYELKVLNATQVQAQVMLFLQQMKKNVRPGQLTPGAFAEPTTNTLVVLAPPEILPVIDSIILELENKTPPTGRAHAYVLRSARADQIANNIDGMLKAKVQEKEGAKKGTLQTAVFADTQSNRLFVYAPDEYQNLAAELIAMVDAEVDSGEIVHIISLTEADATQMAQTLGQVVQGKTSKGGAASVRISADAGSNALLLAGLPKDVADVEKWISELEGNSVRVPELQTFTLKYANPEDVEKWLKNAFPQAKNAQDAVVISSDETTGKLIVFANKRKMREVEAYVAQLDAEPGEDESILCGKQLYFVNVYRGKASDIAWDVRDNLPDEKKGGPKVESDWFGEYIRVTCRPSEYPQVEKLIREFDRRSKPEFTAKIIKPKGGDLERVLTFLKARSGDDVSIQHAPTQTSQESLIEVLHPDGEEPPKPQGKREPSQRTSGIVPFQIGTSLSTALLDEIEAEINGTPGAAAPTVPPIAEAARATARTVVPAATGTAVVALAADRSTQIRFVADEPKPAAPATKPVAPAVKAAAPAAPPAMPPQPKTVGPKPAAAAPKPTGPAATRSDDSAGEEPEGDGAELKKQPTEVIVQPDGTLLIKGQKRGVEDVADTLELLQGDLAVGEVIRIFQFKYGDVTAAAEILSMMFDVQRQQPVIIQQPQQSQQRRQGQQGQGDERDQQGGFMSQFRDMVGGAKSGKSGAGSGQLRMATDPGHNYLIIKCEETALPEIRRLLRELDIPPGEVQVKIFQLKNLIAGETAENIKDVLGISKAQSKRTGAQRTPTQQRPGMPGGQQQQLMEMLQQQLVSVPGVEGGAKVERVEIVSNDVTNALLVSAPPEVMTLIERVINEMEELEGRDVVGVNYYPLQNARVDDILPLLEEVFGAAGGSSGGSSFGRGGRGPMGFMMSTGGGKSPAALGSVSISADPRSNTIIYVCEKKDAETVAKHIRALDIEGTIADVETYVCKHGDAEAIASVLETIFVSGSSARGGMRNPFMGGMPSSSGSDVRIAADSSTNTILVWGPPDKRDQIFRKIEELDKLGDREIREINVVHADPEDLASKLGEIFGGSGGSASSASGRSTRRAGRTGLGGGPTASQAGGRVMIMGDKAAKKLLVRAPDEVFRQITDLVTTLDQPDETMKLKRFQLRYADAEAVVESVKAALTEYMQLNKGLGGETRIDAFTAVPDPRTNSVTVVGSDSTFLFVEQILANIDLPTPADQKKDFRIFVLEKADAVTVADAINSFAAGGAAATSGSGGSRRPRGAGSASPAATGGARELNVSAMADETANTVMVFGRSEDIDTVETAVIAPLEDALIDLRQIANVPVKRASASQVASFIIQFLDQGAQQTSGSGGNRGTRQGLPETNAPRIVPNDAGKELIVRGTKRQIDEIRDLVDRFDNEELVRGRLKVFEVPIGQDALTMSTEIERIVNAAEEENARAAGRDARRVVLGSDEKTNTIIAAGDPTLFGEVETLITQLKDIYGGTNRPVYRVIQLQNVSARDASDMINSLQTSTGGGRAGTRSGTARPGGMRRPSGSGSSGSMSSPRPSGTRSGSGTRSTTPRPSTPSSTPRRTTPRPGGGGAPADGGSSLHLEATGVMPVALGPSAWTEPCVTVLPISPLMMLVAQVVDQAPPVRNPAPTSRPATGPAAARRTPPTSAPADKPAGAAKPPVDKSSGTVKPPSADKPTTAAKQPAAVKPTETPKVPVTQKPTVADKAPGTDKPTTAEQAPASAPRRARRPAADAAETQADQPAPSGRPGLRMPGTPAPARPATSAPTDEPPAGATEETSAPVTMLEGLTGVSGALRGEVTAEVIDSQQIMIIGDERDVDFVEQILRMMEASKPAPAIEIFSLNKAKAVALAPIIEKAIQAQVDAQGLEERFSINAEGGSNSLIVSASPTMLDRIAELVDRLDQGTSERDTAPKMVSLANVRAADAVAILRPQIEKLATIRDIPKDAQPSIEAIDRANSVLIIGTPNEVEEITGWIEAIDVEIPSKGEKAASFVRAEAILLQLKNGVADDVAKVINDMIKAEQEAGTAAASSGGASGSGGSRAAGKAAVKLIKLHLPDGTELPELNLEYPIRIVPEKGTNSLIIFSTPNNNEALKAIVGVFDTLPIGADTDVKAFALKHAGAEEVSKLLTDLFKDKGYIWPPSMGETKSLAKGQLPPMPPGVAAKGLPFPIVVQADVRSNTVIVIGRTDAVMLAAGLISELDQPSANLGLKAYVLQLKNGQAAKMAEKLKKAMDDRSKALGTDKNAARDNAVIAAEERSNALIIWATPEVYELVEDLALQLDASNKYSTVEVRYRSLQHADASKLQGLLEETFKNRQTAESKANKDSTDALNVMADTRSNSLLMSGTRDYLDEAEALIARLDQPMEGSVVFRARKLKLNTAANVSALLQDIVDKALKQQDSKLKGTPIHVTADPVSDTLLLAAAREDMEILDRWIDSLDRPSEIGRMIRIIPLARATAEDVSKSVQDVFKKGGSGSSGSKGQIDMTITPDKTTNSVIAFGPATLLADVEEFVRQLDNVESPKGAMVKTFKLTQADAQDAGDLIQRILDLQGGSVGGTGGRSSGSSGSKTDSAKAIMLILQKDHADLGLETLKAMRSEITVISDLRTNSLVITAPPQSMPLMESLVASVDVPPDAAKIRVFRLRNADPEQMVKTLEELFKQQTASSSGRSGGTANQGERVLTLEGGMGEAGGRQEIAFTSDLRTNSVIAAGTPGYLDVVEKMLLELDTIPIKSRETMVYTPKSSTAKDLAASLKDFSDAEQKRLQDIGKDVSTLVKQERQIGAIANEDANKIVLDYDPRFKDTVMKILHDLDQPPPQVNIQVLIIEVTVDNALDLGMEFAFQDLQYAKAGPADTTTFDYVGGTDIGAAGSGLGGFSFTITGADFNFLFRTLQNEGSLRVLSRPQIVAMDNKEASIDISNDVPYVNGTQTSSTGQIATSVSRQKVGIKLKVTPQINPDGFVRMEVEQEVSDLTGSTVDVGPGVTSPVFFTRNAKTTITVMDSETVVLGGLITSRVENREQKVPLVGDIPGLGMVFRNQSDDSKRVELLLVLTPRVIRTPEEYREQSVVERDRLQLISQDVLRDPLMQGLQIKNDTPAPAGAAPVRRETPPADERLAPPTEEEYGPIQPAVHGAVLPATDPNSYDLPLATRREPGR